MNNMPTWMRRAFSEARLAPYLQACGRPEQAEGLYWWNIEVSAAFYGPLHCLEVTLRNSLHRELQARYGTPGWWDRAPLSTKGTAMVADAQRKLSRLGQPSPGADAIVAELSFGFWVSLVSNGSSYDRLFWVPTLHRAFPHYRGPRRRLHDELYSLLLFRNRIMHHEPIHHRALADDHAKIYRILGYLSPEASTAVARYDRIPTVLGQRAATLAGRRAPQF